MSAEKETTGYRSQSFSTLTAPRALTSAECHRRTAPLRRVRSAPEEHAVSSQHLKSCLAIYITITIHEMQHPYAESLLTK